MSDIVIIIFLILLNGVFSMSEVALISARKTKLSSDARHGNRSAQTALDLANEPDRFLSTIQIGITLIGILTGLYSGAAFADAADRLLQGWGMSPTISHRIAQTSIVIIVTYLSIVVGELVPKRIGMNLADSVSMIVARPMKSLSVIAMPAVWLLSQSTNLIVKLLHLKDQSGKVTEEEIKSLIQEGTESGEVEEVEQDIMERVLVMGDQKVSSIMTNRKDIVTLDTGMSASQVKQVLSQSLHDSYPVLSPDHDDIRGIISLKDLIFTLDRNDFNLEKATKNAVFFPESMRVYDALEILKEHHSHCGLVCDEFGLLQGIVTLRDILEGLIGSIPEPQEQPDIVERADGHSWLVDGQCPMYDFLTYFDREDFYQPDSGYTTLAGLVLETLKHVPTAGETLQWRDFNLEIVDMDGARIDKIMVTRIDKK